MITSFFAPKSKRPADDATDESTVSELTSTDTAIKDRTKRQKVAPNSVTPAKQLPPHVEELLSHLEDPGNTQTPSWRQALSKHTSSPTFSSLAKFVATERMNQTIYPPACDTFSALNLTPLDSVKVVIVGQDPYHGPGQGHGLSFSVRKGIKIPPSLKNIYKELSNDADVDFNMPNHGYLERWAKQGVLMLNAVLTVRSGNANSHAKKGWESFTDQAIRVLVQECNKSNKRLVFLLWGKPASNKAQAILRGGSRHKVICTSHPSPLGASKTNAPFLGSKCFSRANEALREFGFEPIDWNVDGDLNVDVESGVGDIDTINDKTEATDAFNDKLLDV